MRGQDARQEGMFSYVRPEERIPADHPLRRMLMLVDEALRGLDRHLNTLYAPTGRDSIPPERLLRALVLQALYTIRSERQLMEQLNYNLLYRWFVGLGMDDAVWNVTVFTKNRDRLLDGEVATEFFQQVLAQAKAGNLLSDEHFTVDGTLIEAWAGHKSFKRKDGSDGPSGTGKNPDANFRKEQRSNETHQSTTDPEAKLYRKSTAAPALLCYLGHVLMENRTGLVVSSRLTEATGTAERDAALDMMQDLPNTGRVTLGGDKNYDTRAFVDSLRSLDITPHVAQNTSRRGGSAIDKRTTRHPGYAISMRKRKRVEEIFGWLKTIGVLRKTRHKGKKRVGWIFTFTVAVYNLVRIRNAALATG
jgi:transposase